MINRLSRHRVRASCPALLALAVAGLLTACGTPADASVGKTRVGSAANADQHPAGSTPPAPSRRVHGGRPSTVKSRTSFWGFDHTASVPDQWEQRTTGVSTGAVPRAQQAFLAGSRTADVVRGVAGATGGVLDLRVVPSPGYRAANGVVYPFQSAQLRTQGHFSFTYGTITARIKLGVAPGIWPALWMVGTDYNKVPFPASGEIDMMETIGYPDEMREALHGPGYGSDAAAIINSAVPAGFDANAWHVYSSTISARSISFSVDQHVVFTVTRAEVAARGGTWVFDKPRSLVLTLAVGGDWAHQRTGATTPYWGVPAATNRMIDRGDAKMLVDYIRVVSTTP